MRWCWLVPVPFYFLVNQSDYLTYKGGDEVNKDVLKLVRKLAGMTQKELAQKIGVHDSFISKLETGTKKLIPATERKIKEAFHDAGITESDIALLIAVIHSRKDDK
jgi:transcriptional regulator with XRE-family HTH domain